MNGDEVQITYLMTMGLIKHGENLIRSICDEHGIPDTDFFRLLGHPHPPWCLSAITVGDDGIWPQLLGLGFNRTTRARV